MPRWTTLLAVLAILIVALWASGCDNAASPEYRRAHVPTLAVAAGGAITLDRSAASMGTGTPFQGGTHIGAGFTPTNPHVGDAIVATFFWRGSTNVITSVSDHLADGTPVGNTYTLVEYVTDGTMSMATYVATNAQNFPDPNLDENGVLDVHAITSSPVTDDGMILSAYRGVAEASADAFGAHRSAAGLGSSPTTAGPGAITVDAGTLAYGVTAASAPAGVTPPVGFTNITTMSNSNVAGDGEYAVLSSAGTVDPQWTWYFEFPSSWIASVVALKPAGAPGPVRLAFVVQPHTTLPFLAINPPVQVAALDAQGNPATSFGGSVTVAIGHNGGLLIPGKLSGTTTVTAVNGVATFSGLSIDQLGNGYTLTATASGLTGAESAPFNIGPL